MGSFIDLTGKTFNKLYVIRRVGKTVYGDPTWLCRCTCGVEIVVGGNCVRSKQKSCKECYYESLRTHGLTQTKEYHTWEGMKARCYRKTDDSYFLYGGRGIRIDKKWKNSFESFLFDMGKAPSADYSIERIDNNLGYRKSNCKWILKTDQPKNRRTNTMVSINGEIKCVSEWGHVYGVKRNTIYERVKRGWDVISAITTPVSVSNNHKIQMS